MARNEGTNIICCLRVATAGILDINVNFFSLVLHIGRICTKGIISIVKKLEIIELVWLLTQMCGFKLKLRSKSIKMSKIFSEYFAKLILFELFS